MGFRGFEISSAHSPDCTTVLPHPDEAQRVTVSYSVSLLTDTTSPAPVLSSMPRVTHGVMGGVRMGVLRGVAEERVEVLDGVKKPPYRAVENSLTGATTQTLNRCILLANGTRSCDMHL